MAQKKITVDMKTAEEAIDDVTEAFIDAIDAHVLDDDLAVKIKRDAQARILTKVLEAILASDFLNDGVPGQMKFDFDHLPPGSY